VLFYPGPPGDLLGSFGEKLRKQREQRGITLEAISNVTKISTRMLRALEEENFNQLPGGVFNKGFVRAYARQVGLDEEEAISDYLAALRETQIQSQNILPDLRGGKPFGPTIPEAPQRLRHETSPKNLSKSDISHRISAIDEDQATDRCKPASPAGAESVQSGNRSAADLLTADLLTHVQQHESENRASTKHPPAFTTGTFGGVRSGKSSAQVPWAALAVGVLVVCATLAFWNHRRHSRLNPSFAREAASSQPSASSPAVSPTPQPSIAGVSPKLNTASQSARTSVATRPIVMHKGPPTTQGTSVATSTPSPVLSGTPSAPQSEKPASLATSIKTPGALTLLIRAEKTSWVSITADGQLIAQETLIAPAEKSVRASNEIVVKTGNAAGVSFLLNAKEIPAEGNDGEVRTYTFDSSGIKVSPVAQPPNVSH
jgi:transcriptional regulator with XRE-family HTH domain